MAASTVIKHLYDGTITIKDGTGTPISLLVPFTVGDLSISGLQQTQKNVVAYESRGTLNSVRHSSRTYPTGSFSFQIADYSDATSNTAIDFLLKQNSYSANVSTLTTASEVYTVNIVLAVEGTDRGDASDHTITMSNCACTIDPSEGEPNTCSVSFTIYGSVVFV